MAPQRAKTPHHCATLDRGGRKGIHKEDKGSERSWV